MLRKISRELINYLNNRKTYKDDMFFLGQQKIQSNRKIECNNPLPAVNALSTLKYES